MCLRECLRLYPSVPLIAREYAEDLVLSTYFHTPILTFFQSISFPGTGVVPRGCMIGIHIYDLHRNPNIYPEPEKFDPDRFLPEKVQGRHPFSYVPFSAGSRNCIGNITYRYHRISACMSHFRSKICYARNENNSFLNTTKLQTRSCYYTEGFATYCGYSIEK